MPVVIFLAAAVILGGVIVVAMGRGGELQRNRREMASRLDFQTWSDVARYRPPAALLGYHAGVTEHALAVIARTVAERDAEIDWLRRRIAETDPQFGGPGAAATAGSSGTGYGAATDAADSLRADDTGAGSDGPGPDAPGPDGTSAESLGVEGSGAEGLGAAGLGAPRPREAPGKHEFLASPTEFAPDSSGLAGASEAGAGVSGASALAGVSPVGASEAGAGAAGAGAAGADAAGAGVSGARAVEASGPAQPGAVAAAESVNGAGATASFVAAGEAPGELVAGDALAGGEADEVAAEDRPEPAESAEPAEPPDDVGGVSAADSRERVPSVAAASISAQPGADGSRDESE